MHEFRAAATWMDRRGFTVRRRAAPLFHLLHPAYGRCYRCRMPWGSVTYHSTPYDRGHGCFPLCEACWTDLREPAARLPYYRALVDSWRRDFPQSEEKWDRIKAAVLAGK